MIIQNVWEEGEAGPAAYLLADVILPDGLSATKAQANECSFAECGVPLAQQRSQATDNAVPAIAEQELTKDRHPDPDLFDHNGCDPHRWQLGYRKMVHGLNGPKKGMHDFGVEVFIYKLPYLCASDPIAHKEYLESAARAVYGSDEEEKIKSVLMVKRALIDKWEECVEPLTRLLDHWDVWLYMAKKLSVPKGKGGLLYSRNYRCGEWGVVAEWMQEPTMKFRVLHFLEAAIRVAEEQRWSRGTNSLFNFACGFRQHEMAARMATHRLPLIESFSKKTEPLPTSVFKRTRAEFQKLDKDVQAEMKDALDLNRQGFHNDMRFWMVQWTEVDALFGLVTHPTLGPEFVRQVVLKHRPAWVGAQTKVQWKTLSSAMNSVEQKRIKNFLDKSWHTKYRKNLEDLGTVAPEYDVWAMISWYWTKHNLDRFRGEWIEIASEAEFEFKECNVTDPFWEHHINNHFTQSMSNEKVITCSL